MLRKYESRMSSQKSIKSLLKKFLNRQKDNNCFNNSKSQSNFQENEQLKVKNNSINEDVENFDEYLKADTGEGFLEKNCFKFRLKDKSLNEKGKSFKEEKKSLCCCCNLVEKHKETSNFKVLNQKTNKKIKSFNDSNENKKHSTNETNSNCCWQPRDKSKESPQKNSKNSPLFEDTHHSFNHHMNNGLSDQSNINKFKNSNTLPANFSYIPTSTLDPSSPIINIIQNYKKSTNSHLIYSDSKKKLNTKHIITDDKKLHTNDGKVAGLVKEGSFLLPDVVPKAVSTYFDSKHRLPSKHLKNVEFVCCCSACRKKSCMCVKGKTNSKAAKNKTYNSWYGFENNMREWVNVGDDEVTKRADDSRCNEKDASVNRKHNNSNNKNNDKSNNKHNNDSNNEINENKNNSNNKNNNNLTKKANNNQIKETCLFLLNSEAFLKAHDDDEEDEDDGDDDDACMLINCKYNKCKKSLRLKSKCEKLKEPSNGYHSSISEPTNHSRHNDAVKKLASFNTQHPPHPPSHSFHPQQSNALDCLSNLFNDKNIYLPSNNSFDVYNPDKALQKSGKNPSLNRHHHINSSINHACTPNNNATSIQPDPSNHNEFLKRQSAYTATTNYEHLYQTKKQTVSFVPSPPSIMNKNTSSKNQSSSSSSFKCTQSLHPTCHPPPQHTTTPNLFHTTPNFPPSVHFSFDGEEGHLANERRIRNINRSDQRNSFVIAPNKTISHILAAN